MAVEVEVRIGFKGLVLRQWGLAPEASWPEVKARYRALAKEHHPDLGGDPETFKRLKAQYDALERTW